METIVKVIMVLTLATAAAAAIKKVEPEKFQCDTDSPTNDPVYSDTTPPVALTHIFCGQVIKGKAKGFHSRALVNKVGKACAIATEPIKCDKNHLGMADCSKCAFTAGAKVSPDSTDAKYITKTSSGGGPYIFFPDSWGAKKIVDVALEAFDKLPAGETDYCLKDVKIDGCEGINVKIFTNGALDTKILSAFPVDDSNCT